MIVRELLTRFSIAVDTNKLKKFDKQIKGIGLRLNKVGSEMSNVGKNMTAFVSLPLAALGASFVKASSDAVETSSKFGVVFGDIGDKADQTAKELSRSFGLSSTGAKELLGDTGDLLTGFGFAQGAALDLSTNVNKLAVDLASFTNFSGGAKGASQALTKALLGERESIKSLGISILEEDVKKQVAIQRSQGLRFETERQAKAYATLTLAQKQSKNAIGDFARNQDTLATKMKILSARFQDVSEKLGDILLPHVITFTDKLVKILEKIDDLSPSMKEAIVYFGAFLVVLGPILFVLGKFIVMLGMLITFWPALVAGITAAIVAVKAFAAVWVVLAAKLALIGAAIAFVGLLLDDIYHFVTGKSSLIERALVSMFGQKDWDGIKTGFWNLVNSIGDAINWFFGLFSKENLNKVVDGFVKYFIDPIMSKFNKIKNAWGTVKGLVGDAADFITGDNSIENTLMQEPSLSGSNALLGGNTKNEVTYSPKIEVNVATNADAKEIGDQIAKKSNNGFEEILRHSMRMNQTGAI